MQSSFDTSRIFNDQTGWFVVMRQSDEPYLTGSKYKFIGNMHLMGPFLSKNQVENWLDKYISTHGSHRHADKLEDDNE